MSRVLAIAVLLLGTLPAAAVASEGEKGFINLDSSLLIQMLNFGLLLAVLWRFLYRPLLAKMEERSQAIRKSLEEAQAARAEAQRERDEHAARIRAAHAEAQAIRAAALTEAAEEQRRLVEAARAEAARLVESAKAELEQDVRRARQQIVERAFAQAGGNHVQAAAILGLHPNNLHRLVRTLQTRDRQ